MQEKHHPCKLQVMPTASASGVYALTDGRINTSHTDSASCRGSRPSWANCLFLSATHHFGVITEVVKEALTRRKGAYTLSICTCQPPGTHCLAIVNARIKVLLQRLRLMQEKNVNSRLLLECYWKWGTIVHCKNTDLLYQERQYHDTAYPWYSGSTRIIIY